MVAWMLLIRCIIYFIYLHFFSLSWQVSALCSGVSGSVSPWVQLSVANVMDPNTQYHDFRAITNMVGEAHIQYHHLIID